MLVVTLVIHLVFFRFFFRFYRRLNFRVFFSIYIRLIRIATLITFSIYFKLKNSKEKNSIFALYVDVTQNKQLNEDGKTLLRFRFRQVRKYCGKQDHLKSLSFIAKLLMSNTSYKLQQDLRPHAHPISSFFASCLYCHYLCSLPRTTIRVKASKSVLLENGRKKKKKKLFESCFKRYRSFKSITAAKLPYFAYTTQSLRFEFHLNFIRWYPTDRISFIAKKIEWKTIFVRRWSIQNRLHWIDQNNGPFEWSCSCY